MEKREKIFLSSDERCQTYLNHKSIVLTTICSLSPHHIYINCARTTSTTYNDDINLQHHRFSCFNKFVVVILSLDIELKHIAQRDDTTRKRRRFRGRDEGGWKEANEFHFKWMFLFSLLLLLSSTIRWVLSLCVFYSCLYTHVYVSHSCSNFTSSSIIVFDGSLFSHTHFFL